MTASARDIIARCKRIAQFSGSSGGTTRTFLCPAMHDVHRFLADWMQSLGMEVTVDAMGNLHGVYPPLTNSNDRRLLIGSHLDTVPNAGAFDGILGVVLGIALIESLQGERLPFGVEVIGFSEEEGVRFGIPFLGSRAAMGRIDSQLLKSFDADGITIAEAIRSFGLNPAEIGQAFMHPGVFAYIEFHIEQGPVLDHLGQPLGVVRSIAGQSRYGVAFSGAANHAGTTPMHLRHDALAGAAEWITNVEAQANNVAGAVATVAAIASAPRASNVIPGVVTATLDVRHSADDMRTSVVRTLLCKANEIAANRGLQFVAELRLDQQSVAMDAGLISVAQNAVRQVGCDAPLMVSGAGHDAMVLADNVPCVMVFLRSPGGISHHPDEAVLLDDVQLALSAGLQFLHELAAPSKLRN